MELASGFIFSEVECENRTYQTWWAQVSEWFNQGNGIVGVSQRWGKSISQAGLSGLGCPSLPDMFHLLYALSKSIVQLPVNRCNCKNSTKAYKRNSKRSHLLPPSLRCQPKSQYYKPNRTNWKSTVRLSAKFTRPVPNYSPLDLNTGNLIWVRVTHSVAVHFG